MDSVFEGAAVVGGVNEEPLDCGVGVTTDSSKAPLPFRSYPSLDSGKCLLPNSMISSSADCCMMLPLTGLVVFLSRF